MAKRVMRWKPAGSYDLLALENWLEELAEKEGLFLVQWLPLVAIFEPGEPRRVRYRFELAETFREDIKAEQIAFYRECGWEEIETAAYYHIFRAEEGAEELHTDRAMQLEPYRKRERSMLIGLWIMLALVIMQQAAGRSIVPVWQPVHWLAEPNEGIVILVLLVVVIFYRIHEYRAMKRLYEKRKAGEMAPEQDWRAVRRKRRIGNGVCAAVVAIACLPVVINWFVKWEKPHTEVGELPYVSLHELLGKDLTDYLYREEWTEHFGSITFGYDAMNGVYYTWAPLAPVRYEETQMDAVENLQLSVDYTRLRTEGLAEGFFEEECAEFEERERLKGVPVNVVGLDEGVLYRSSVTEEHLILRKGCAVAVYTTYEEALDLEAFAAQIAAGLE